GLGAEWIRPPGGGCPALDPCRQRISFGGGIGTGFASLGLAYHWYASHESHEIDDLGTFDAGILLRPASWLSFGAVAQALDAPNLGLQTLPRVYTMGIGIRPAGRMLTLSADVAVDDRRGWAQSSFQY